MNIYQELIDRPSSIHKDISSPYIARYFSKTSDTDRQSKWLDESHGMHNY